MQIAFDPDKDAINRDKHGVSLVFGGRVLADPGHVIVPTIRQEDDEERYKAIGRVQGKLWTAIHVRRDTVIRFVSVRRSNDGERRIYDRP